jgi:hypothetical protein
LKQCEIKMKKNIASGYDIISRWCSRLYLLTSKTKWDEAKKSEKRRKSLYLCHHFEFKYFHMTIKVEFPLILDHFLYNKYPQSKNNIRIRFFSASSFIYLILFFRKEANSFPVFSIELFNMLFMALRVEPINLIWKCISIVWVK